MESASLFQRQVRATRKPRSDPLSLSPPRASLAGLRDALIEIILKDEICNQRSSIYFGIVALESHGLGSHENKAFSSLDILSEFVFTAAGLCG